MATIDTGAAMGTKRKVRATPRIDMTPMVDLGFLLITFFIFTTSMSASKALNLIMPKDGPDPNNSAESGTLSVILSDKKVVAYRGEWTKALKENRVQETTLATFNGIGEAIRQLQKRLEAQGRKGELMFLIKPTKSAAYSQVIDAIDQALINQVGRYAIVEADGEEDAYVSSQAAGEKVRGLR